MAMHGCDVMVCVGARFDDRITGVISEFSPNSKKIHIDIDPSSINKNVSVDVPIIGDVGNVLGDMLNVWKTSKAKPDQKALRSWWKQIDEWRARDCLNFVQEGDIIKPQHAIRRLYEATKKIDDVFITTEVGQHQMWAAQFYGFEEPNRWMTSGGLGTMGYGLPAAVGTQVAHPEALVVDIAGEASILMNIQEMSTIAQYNLPVKIFILNNEYMGMVRQWQELLHGGRYAESYMESLPDFKKLAESFGAVGMRVDKAGDLDGMIEEMLKTEKAVIADIHVEKLENCYPMIPSGAAHNDMLLGPEEQSQKPISKDGMVLV
jgi:acetolactate synthase-1/2/3 large subunit